MAKWIIAVIASGLLSVVALQYFDKAQLMQSLRLQNDAAIATQLAHHYGVAAYLYGYPIVDMHRQMHNETNRVAPDQRVYAPRNRLYRFTELVTPATSAGLRAPNNDTLYFSGWFDIASEPVIIHTPDTAGRYFTIAVTNMYSEVTHIGRRATGTHEGYFALVPPGWEGDLPEGVRPVPVETPTGWLLGRMYVAGKDDLPVARALVDDIWLAVLSEFTPGQPPADPPAATAQPSEPLASLEFFDILNRAFKTYPARAGEAALLAQFDAIGVGPNSDFDPARLSAAARKGLEQALVDGQEIVQASTLRTIAASNGWMISTDIGRYGYQYMHRASVVKGGYGNLPEESLYPATFLDDSGDMLSGERSYQLRFEAGQLPPVAGFWSLAAYTLDAKLAANSIERYSIGDRTQGLEYGNDGSLTLYLQHQPPASGLANWLPTPADNFVAIMRLYEPAHSVLANDYQLPRITRID